MYVLLQVRVHSGFSISCNHSGIHGRSCNSGVPSTTQRNSRTWAFHHFYWSCICHGVCLYSDPKSNLIRSHLPFHLLCHTHLTLSLSLSLSPPPTVQQPYLIYVYILFHCCRFCLLLLINRRWEVDFMVFVFLCLQWRWESVLLGCCFLCFLLSTRYFVSGYKLQSLAFHRDMILDFRRHL